MSVTGTPKFSTLVVREILADISGMATKLEGKAAFVGAGGATHGFTKGEGAVWSKETLERLTDLQLSMERDLARLHFGDDQVAAIGRTMEPVGFGGIGEHLEEADQA